jgi:hypothetical protein
MAEREKYLNFAILFGGVDSYIIWHTNGGGGVQNGNDF